MSLSKNSHPGRKIKTNHFITTDRLTGTDRVQDRVPPPVPVLVPVPPGAGASIYQCRYCPPSVTGTRVPATALAPVTALVLRPVQ